MKKTAVWAMAAFAALGLSSSAHAGFTPDTNLQHGVIFGSGNANGDFAVGTDATGDFEVGIRAKIPHDGSTQLTTAGTNTYSFATGVAWNFDWGVNTDVLGDGGVLDDYTYKFVFDHYTIADGHQVFESNPMQTYFIFYPDHALGNNTTTQNATTGNEASNVANFASLLKTFNVAQNSWSLGQFGLPGSTNYDVNEDATYNITLSIMEGVNTIAASDIWVNVGTGGLPVVPLPGAAALGFLGMGLIGLRRRFQKAQTIA